MLDRLVAELREQEKYHELFDALLLRARYRLGLPVIITSPLEDLPEPIRTQVEDSYLAACREVGGLLLSAGNLRAAWMYLRPVGDKQLVATALAKIDPDEDNLEDIIEIALHEGMAPGLGYQLVLEHRGTCDAISTFEAALSGRPRGDQQTAATLLVRHLYRELVASLREDIRRHEGTDTAETSLVALLTDRDWLFLNNNYHIDTTHLAATVRYAKVIDEAEVLRLAIELTEYGRQLSRQFQFFGEEPFVDLYATHALFFRALLGEGVESALQFFQERAAAVKVEEGGTLPAETYVSLLARLGRFNAAVDAAAEFLPSRVRGAGLAPSLLELSQLAGNYDRLLEMARAKDDLVSYTAGLLARGGARQPRCNKKVCPELSFRADQVIAKLDPNRLVAANHFAAGVRTRLFWYEAEGSAVGAGGIGAASSAGAEAAGAAVPPQPHEGAAAAAQPHEGAAGAAQLGAAAAQPHEGAAAPQLEPQLPQPPKRLQW